MSRIGEPTEMNQRSNPDKKGLNMSGLLPTATDSHVLLAVKEGHLRAPSVNQRRMSDRTSASLLTHDSRGRSRILGRGSGHTSSHKILRLKVKRSGNFQAGLDLPVEAVVHLGHVGAVLLLTGRVDQGDSSRKSSLRAFPPSSTLQHLLARTSDRAARCLVKTSSQILVEDSLW